ncbi:hypothetical protein BDN67DRAFT_984737 [Paxillus ammoniavirescens]|nr:hypothetical protein BDN67DRAFT_984737 [Paxillus ammoniavirescens]
MLGAFCAAARVKVLLQHPDAPKIVRDASNILKVHCSASDDGALATNIDVFHMLIQTGETNWTVDGDAKVEEVPALVKRALVAAGIEGHLDVQLNIFSCSNGKPKYFVVTHRNLPVPNLMTDLFKAYKDFGTGLWKDEHATELDILQNEGGKYLLLGNQWLQGGNGYRRHDLCFNAGTMVLIVCNADNIDGEETGMHGWCCSNSMRLMRGYMSGVEDGGRWKRLGHSVTYPNVLLP